jgi:hypothetical protein
MERRDEERAARVEVARLEEECRELERKFEAARADAKLASAKTVLSATRLQVTRFPFRFAKPANRRDHSEMAAAEMDVQISTDSDPLGPKYGP